jgi:hypothetical protein
MYVVKIQHGHSLSLSNVEQKRNAYPQLWWEDDDGKPERIAAVGRRYGCPHDAEVKWAEASAREEGYGLKEKYDRYLKKHKERMEIVREREAAAAAAAAKLAREQRDRAAKRVSGIITLLRRVPGPAGIALADFIEKGDPA